jgi:hypothetical protein
LFFCFRFWFIGREGGVREYGGVFEGEGGHRGGGRVRVMD